MGPVDHARRLRCRRLAARPTAQDARVAGNVTVTRPASKQSPKREAAAELGELIKLNLGCGADTPGGLVNVDRIGLPGVDVVADLDVRPWPWKPGTVEYIKASHVFEHVADPVVFMTEAWRVLAVDGLLDIRVPGGGYLGPGVWLPHEHSFTDPTHKRHCTPHSWDYWTEGTMLFDAYGPGLGGGRGGAVYACTYLAVNGELGEELQVILRKVAD